MDTRQSQSYKFKETAKNLELKKSTGDTPSEVGE